MSACESNFENILKEEIHKFFTTYQKDFVIKVDGLNLEIYNLKTGEVEEVTMKDYKQLISDCEEHFRTARRSIKILNNLSKLHPNVDFEVAKTGVDYEINRYGFMRRLAKRFNLARGVEYYFLEFQQVTCLLDLSSI